MADFIRCSLRSRRRMFSLASRRRMFSLRSRRRIFSLASRRRMFSLASRRRIFSLRSRRERKAWGVSPRFKNTTAFEPANAGDRTAATHVHGLELKLIRDPGAHAPGFTLTPASQAQVKNTTAFERTPPWSAATCRRFAPTSEVLNSGPKRRQVAALQGGA